MNAVQASLPTWLFVSYGGGHVKALLPVASRVRDLGIARPVYLALTTAAAVVKAAGVPVLGFRDFMTPSDERARSVGEAMADRLQVQAAERAESVAYLGLSYVDLEQQLGVRGAADQYRQYGRQAFLPLGILERVIHRCQPSLVIATNSPRAEKAAIQTSRKMGVPSVCLVDLFGIWERDLLAHADYADALCVLNEAVRDSLVRAGRPGAHVEVTGNPAFDTVRDAAMVAQGMTCRRQAGWEGLRVLLYASSPEPVSIPGVEGRGDPAFPRRIESALIRAVRANPNLALWVRRHPSEPPVTEFGAEAHPRIRVSPGDMPLHACIHASDEVIVSVSTVGVEASLASKPVTQIRGSILDHLSPYVAMGIADRELRVEEIGRAYAKDTSAIHRMTGKSSGGTANATEKVVQVLQSVQERRHGR
jgi:hypothetical protein